jgi:hypothetical protein
MCTTYSRPAARHLPRRSGTSGASYRFRVTKLVLIAAIASVALSGALIAAPVAKQPASGSADQLQVMVAAKKKTAASAKLRCPPRFTAKCNKHQRVVCVQNDSSGCCTKSICR